MDLMDPLNPLNPAWPSSPWYVGNTEERHDGVRGRDRHCSGWDVMLAIAIMLASMFVVSLVAQWRDSHVKTKRLDS